jgi:hypothetical protein
MALLKLDRTVVTISNGDSKERTDFSYWKSLPIEKVLEAIQFLRVQYNPDLNDSSIRLQTVYIINKLEKN